MALATEIVYKSRNNAFDKQLKRGGVVTDLTSVTKVGILFLGNYYHSDKWPTAFDYTTQKALGIITFKLANIATIAVGKDENTELIIYDATNPNGIVWGTFDLEVREITGTEVSP